MSNDELDQQCIDTLRFLSVDMVQKAKSGHRACRSAPRRWPTCCGRAFSSTIPPTRSGPTATASSSPPATARPCSTATSTSPAQPQSYRDEVLPPKVTARLAVELGVEQGWRRYIGDRGDMLGIDRFGASAPADVLLEKYGFTVDNVMARAKRLLAA